MRLAEAAQLLGALLLVAAIGMLAGVWWAMFLGGGLLLTAGTLAEKTGR